MSVGVELVAVRRFICLPQMYLTATMSHRIPLFVNGEPVCDGNIKLTVCMSNGGFWMHLPAARPLLGDTVSLNRIR